MATINAPTSDVQRQPAATRSFGMTDKGRVRASNEDQFLIAELRKTLRIRQTSLSEPLARRSEEQGQVFLVADGMGGRAAGEQASAWPWPPSSASRSIV